MDKYLSKILILIFISTHLNPFASFSVFKSPKQLKQKHICNMCECLSLYSVKCIIEKRSEQIWMNALINASFFNGLDESIENLKIDVDYFNLNLKIDHSTFTKMRNLQQLEFNNIFDMVNIPNLDNQDNLKELRIQRSNLKYADRGLCQAKSYLVTVDFSYNDFENLNYVFDDCSSLSLLDLSYNRLSSMENMFNKKSSLINLNLDNNRIEEIGQFDLQHLTQLMELSVSKNNIKFIHENAFDNLRNLIELKLYKNNLHTIPMKSIVYGSLELLNIEDNPNLIYFPNSELFTHLRVLKVHYSYHCCPFRAKTISSGQKSSAKKYIDEHQGYIISDLVPDSSKIRLNNESTEEFKILMGDTKMVIAQPYDKAEKAIDKEIDVFKKEPIKNRHFVSCSPMPDPFQPCENLLEDWWLRIAVWLVSILGVLSNVCVVTYNIVHSILHYYYNYDVNVSTFLLTNLATADSLMSIYLLFIAIKDATSRHNFVQTALVWQRSFKCNLAGFLSIMSSVSSALCLAFITFERYYAIKNSFDYNKRISIKAASVCTFFIWFISIIAASLPLLNFNSYSTYAICLPFDMQKNIYKVYIIGLDALLVSCFFFICICYAMIFINTMIVRRRTSLTMCNNQTQLKLRSAEHQKLARNISLLVIANIICWGPVVYVSVKALTSSLTPAMDREHLKLLAIFVIPFNSLINPFLYCISRRGFIMDLKENLFRAKLRKSLISAYSTTSRSSSHPTT